MKELKPPMNRSHPQWREFIERLAGPEGCDFRLGGEWGNNDDQPWWDCDGTFEIAKKVLANYDVDYEASIEYLADHVGDGCSCSVVLEFGSDDFWSR
jgi:hypothetical protein